MSGPVRKPPATSPGRPMRPGGPESLRSLLLQVRNGDDPMRRHEVDCFARALACPASQIRVFDLLAGVPSRRLLDQVDLVLLGGSGHYSVAGRGAWLEGALDALREIHSLSKPTFASCWGFQAMARALGGRVVHAPSCAELGTIRLRLTPEGKQDPIFAPLGERFGGQSGHEDCVVRLPAEAVRLASSEKVDNQAYCFPGRPIYCTQFHPELRREDLLCRVRAYPEYVRHIAGMTVETFAAWCDETPETDALLARFVHHVFG